METVDSTEASVGSLGLVSDFLKIKLIVSSLLSSVSWKCLFSEDKSYIDLACKFLYWRVMRNRKKWYKWILLSHNENQHCHFHIPEVQGNEFWYSSGQLNSIHVDTLMLELKWLIFCKTSVNFRKMCEYWCKFLLFQKGSITLGGLILGLHPANERRHYKVMPSHWLGANLESALIKPSPPKATCKRQWTGSALVQILACRLFGAKPLSKKNNAGLLSIGTLGTNFSET